MVPVIFDAGCFKPDTDTSELGAQVIAELLDPGSPASNRGEAVDPAIKLSPSSQSCLHAAYKRQARQS